MLAFLSLWVVGVVMVAFQGLFAAVGIGLIRRRSVKAAFESLNLPEMATRVGLKRAWELRVSTTTTPPAAMTWGFVRPVVLLPQDSVTWPDERTEAVLLHELAHVRRGDSLSQLLAFSVCALFWFHPAIWLCARRMRAEAEAAADDTVLLSGITPSTYAAELLRFAAQLGRQRQPFTRLGVSMLKQAKIEARIESIVDPSRHRAGVTPGEARKAVVFGLFLLLLVSLRPSFSAASAQQASPPAPRKPESPTVVRAALQKSLSLPEEPSSRPRERRSVVHSSPTVSHARAVRKGIGHLTPLHPAKSSLTKKAAPTGMEEDRIHVDADTDPDIRDDKFEARVDALTQQFQRGPMEAKQLTVLTQKVMQLAEKKANREMQRGLEEVQRETEKAFRVARKALASLPVPSPKDKDGSE